MSQPVPPNPGSAAAVRAGVLELRGLSKVYPGAPRPAVDDLSMIVPAGQVCVLIGPSGCGKTTALRMINRLAEPTSGEVLIDAVDVRSRPPAQLRREIGYVIQQVGLLPHLTIAQNVATVPRLLQWDRARTAERVEELLALVGLPQAEYGNRYPSELSGGQQQRVGLARALAGDPPLMLMDEPFSAVDPVTRARLQNDFLALHRRVPKTVVFVSHDIDEAVKMADVVAVMRDGRLVQCAPPSTLLTSPADEYVASFVGSDRALKRLALQRLEAIPLTPVPALRAGEAVADARARIAAGTLTLIQGAALVVDESGRPVRWVDVKALTERVPDGPRMVAPILEGHATLRDALAALVEAGTSYGVVVDGDGRALGLVGVEDITGRLRGPEEYAADA